MRYVQSEGAPAPGGHYSHAVTHNGFVFVAGQLPVRPGDSEHRPGPIAEQTEQALRNVQAILESAGSGLDRVVQMTIYVSDIALWADVNAVYARFMGPHRPARAVVPVKELHFGYQIEIQAIAAG
jgi:2-iminobutanoate/2-iminopropanoate deaminase